MPSAAKSSSVAPLLQISNNLHTHRQCGVQEVVQVDGQEVEEAFTASRLYRVGCVVCVWGERRRCTWERELTEYKANGETDLQLFIIYYLPTTTKLATYLLIWLLVLTKCLIWRLCLLDSYKNWLTKLTRQHSKQIIDWPTVQLTACQTDTPDRSLNNWLMNELIDWWSKHMTD